MLLAKGGRRPQPITQLDPTAATSTPPTAGPAILTVFWPILSSAFAAYRISAGTTSTTTPLAAGVEKLLAAPHSADTATMAATRGPNEELLARGIRSRTIYLDSVRNDKATLERSLSPFLVVALCGWVRKPWRPRRLRVTFMSGPSVGRPSSRAVRRP